MAMLKFRKISLEDFEQLEVKDPNTRYIVYNEDGSVFGEFIGEEKVTAEIEEGLEEKADNVNTLSYKGVIYTWDNWFDLEDGLYLFDGSVSDEDGHGPPGSQDKDWSSLMIYKGLYGSQAIAFAAYNREMWTCALQEGDIRWRKVSYSDGGIYWQGKTSAPLGDIITNMLGQLSNSHRPNYMTEGEPCDVYELTVVAYNDSEPYQGTTMIYVPQDEGKRIVFYLSLAGLYDIVLVDHATDLTAEIEELDYFGYRVLLKKVATRQSYLHSYS